MKKIYILIGDPNNDTERLSLNTMLAHEYEKGAKEAGHEVRIAHLADLQFDPVLHKGYRVIQALEPDLLKVQEDMKWCDHMVILFPVWWASLPSLLKGLFDRIWIPGFAFHFKKNGLKRTDHWIKELEGRTCRIIQTSGTSKWMIRRKFGQPSHVLIKGILGFAGIGPCKVTWFGSVNNAEEKRVERWKKKVVELGRKGR
jgi:NAD(P)H dehydrogenase (quinone)